MAGKVYIRDEVKKNNTAAGGGRTNASSAGSATSAGSASAYSHTFKNSRTAGSTAGNTAGSQNGRRTGTAGAGDAARSQSGASGARKVQEDKEIEELARRMLKKKEQRRRGITIGVFILAALSIGAFIFYSVSDYKKSTSYQMLSTVREKHGTDSILNNETLKNDEVVIHYDEEKAIPDILPEFQEMLAVNSKLIGWLKIDDTNIDYPVAQTTDNEYYLDHDLNQNKDRNGTIFLDTNCDVIKPSTNLILYGHHMRSGNMFGNLGKYENESYYEKHKYITFDTLYEYGTYEVMYVFRSHVYSETEVAFKYYQFIDAYSEVEFNSYMDEMAAMSLYDTGVTAEFGDRLLTLSTCDYQEKDGRFVVVAKKIK